MTHDFERAWQDKLGRSIEAQAGAEVRALILAGGEQLSDPSPRLQVIEWSEGAISRLEQCLPLQTAQDLLTQCACHYPHEALQPMKEAFRQRGDILEIHEMLRAHFRDFLSVELRLEPDEIESLLGQGWGLAGLLEGNTIVAKKIPKSGNLHEYLNEDDPQRRREMYCHCPRVREAVVMGKSLPMTYCYCGAGFYRDIWETILDKAVQVEVRSSVLHGDDVCTIAIHLPV
ncbi:MAG: hypothetical protein E4G99_09850 [Anaerolineales bacterium]|nr:MAG: hypothetical protein E4G99_09850 [Anaerolineales bacterium]